MKKLNYVFTVQFLSCKGDGSWTHVRSTYLHPNKGNQSPAMMAATIAADCLAPAESGVRVNYLGLREVEEKGMPVNPITPMNNLTVEIRRVPDV